MTAIFARTGTASRRLGVDNVRISHRRRPHRLASSRTPAAAARRRAPRDPPARHAQPAQPRLPARHGGAGRDARAVGRQFLAWREVMYRFALAMTPDQVEAVAAQLYVEMLEAGFSRVGEFHYLHHDRDGKPYADIAEMAERIAAAAAETGIGLTLLPVFYAHSELRRRRAQRRPAPLHQRSRRLRPSARRLPRGGIAGRRRGGRRRAAQPARGDAGRTGRGGGAGAVTAPIHIHVAEQIKEVEDCLAWSGARPVEWLLANAEVDRPLVPDPRHPHDRSRDAAHGGKRRRRRALPDHRGQSRRRHLSGAAVFVEHGGRFGIGSDSNVLIGVRRRTAPARIFAAPRPPRPQRACSAGRLDRRALFDAALAGGSAGARRRHIADLQLALRPISSRSTPTIRRLPANPATPSSTPGSSPTAPASTASGCAAESWSKAAVTVKRDAIAAKFRKTMLELLTA